MCQRAARFGVHTVGGYLRISSLTHEGAGWGGQFFFVFIAESCGYINICIQEHCWALLYNFMMFVFLFLNKKCVNYWFIFMLTIILIWFLRYSKKKHYKYIDIAASILFLKFKIEPIG